jgi:hypothetical protein
MRPAPPKTNSATCPRKQLAHKIYANQFIDMIEKTTARQAAFAAVEQLSSPFRHDASAPPN